MPKLKRTITLSIDVTVDATVGESEVERAINEALDEPPNDWADWEVGAAVITLEEAFEIGQDTILKQLQTTIKAMEEEAQSCLRIGKNGSSMTSMAEDMQLGAIGETLMKYVKLLKRR